MRRATTMSAIVGGLAVMACTPPARLGADLVLTNARIWTGDRSNGEAAALAVIGDRIVAVGSADEIERWRASNTTRVIDAEGRRVVAGFNDAHVHFATGSAQLARVDLRDADSPAEFARRIVERARSEPGEWILGGEWDERRWTPASLPTRALVDDATNGTPVFVMRVDGRAALANAAALGRAGVTEHTADPPGGVIVRDARGFPTGLLKDAAMELVARVVPRMTPEERRQTILQGLRHAASFGITSAHDMNPDGEDIAVYADLAGRGELTTRIYAAPIDTAWFEQAKLGIRRAFGSPSLRIGALSGDADRQPVDQLLTRWMAADHAGLQLCVNPGDAGVAKTLDLLADVIRANGERDRRFRVERAEQSTASDVDRFAALNAVASIQPASREAAAGAIARLRDRRVRLAFGTDWPALPLNPMPGLAAAGRHMPIAEALGAYTRGSAAAEFQDGDKGTLERGKLADIVILSDDLLAVRSDRVRSVTVLTTIVGGKVVHQRRP
jgi:predicted amidohydrolase YtcJ